MRSVPFITCGLLIILSAIAALLYYGHGLYRFDPDYDGYLSIFVSSIDLSDKPEKLFYWVANQTNRFGGSYTAFRSIVLAVAIALTGASILAWAKVFKLGDVRPSCLLILALALIPLVSENFFVRIRVGLAEPLIALALALIYWRTQNVSSSPFFKWTTVFGGLLLLLSAPFIHLQASMLLIPVALILMGFVWLDKRYTIFLALLLGVGLTTLVDWQSQFRFEVLYSQYHVVRYLALNLGQILLLLLMLSLKPRLQRWNYFDLFLMFYTGISLGITMLFFVHPMLISGEALVRFQSVFAIIALLGALYASPRLNLVWLYILLVNGAFFLNSIITHFFDVKKLFA